MGAHSKKNACAQQKERLRDGGTAIGRGLRGQEKESIRCRP